MATYRMLKDLPEALQAADSDLLLLDTEEGTKKIQKKNLAPNVDTDPVPTKDSIKPVQSGGVYEALLEKQTKNVVVTETLVAGNNQVTFHDDRFTDDKHIYIFVDDSGINPNEVTFNVSTKILTLTFDIYPDNHVVKVLFDPSN